MHRRETERILSVIREISAAGQRAAIATVVRVKGSAYRREGARIIVREDGTHECLLSGGCLEPTVAAAAAQVIATGEPVVVSFDLAEDSVFGLGIGCTGAVDIRIERVGDDPVTRAWLEVLERADPAALVTPLSAASGRLLVHADGSVIGALSDASLESQAVIEALRRCRAPNSYSGADHIGHAEVFYEVSQPLPRIVMFGAGDDAVPLARLGWEMGFSVAVVDVRETFLTRERFPGAMLVSAHFSQFATAVPLNARSYVLVMNHHLDRDRESLRFALASDATYIGVLGPRTRYRKLLVGLDAQDDVSLARVRNPVGLALGAETPEEIAVSIMGEILATRRGFEGGFLSGRETSLHRDSRLFARS